jgi:hypothetical protein
MIEDLPAIRQHLSDHWQTIALDLVKRGFAPQAVFETLTTIGLVGEVELSGKEAVAKKLIAIAERLSEQVRQEACDSFEEDAPLAN